MHEAPICRQTGVNALAADAGRCRPADPRAAMDVTPGERSRQPLPGADRSPARPTAMGTALGCRTRGADARASGGRLAAVRDFAAHLGSRPRPGTLREPASVCQSSKLPRLARRAALYDGLAGARA